MRDAFVTSETWAPPSAAAGQIPGEPALDRAGGELAALRPARALRDRCRAARRASWPRSTAGSAGRCARARGPRLRRRRARRTGRRCACPARRSRSRSGRPVARSQTTIVSRWFVIPTPATRLGSTSASTVAGAGGDRLEQLERIVLDEARLRVVLAMRQLPLGDPAAGRVDERGPARGRALVESEDEIGGDGGLLRRRVRRYRVRALAGGRRRGCARAGRLVGCPRARPEAALRSTLGGRARRLERSRQVGAVDLRRVRYAERTGATSGSSTGTAARSSAGTHTARSPSSPASPSSSSSRCRPPPSRRRSTRRSRPARRRSSRSRPGSARSTRQARHGRQPSSSGSAAAGAVMLGPNCLGVYDAAAELDLGCERPHTGLDRRHLPERQPRARAVPDCRRLRPRGLAFRVAREPGRPRGGRADRGVRRRRRDAG